MERNGIEDMSYLFNNMSSIEKIDFFDTSNVTNMHYMCRNCSRLKEFPPLDTSQVTDMYGLFYGCNSLIKIAELDVSNVDKFDWFFYQCSNLTDVGGFKNLGKSITQPDFTFVLGNDVPKITFESLKNIANDLYNVTSLSFTKRCMKVTGKAAQNLSVSQVDELRSIVEGKGWSYET